MASISGGSLVIARPGGTSPMNRLSAALAVTGVLAAAPALAALKPGDAAPDFTAKAALGGKEFDFSLADALKKGPVVLYFYPKAFTSGCTVEAHDFAEAADQYTSLGATLIGMSSDTIEQQHEFSTKECSAKFPVAADPDLKVIHEYDVVLSGIPGLSGVSNRTSYVIAPDGKILYAYTAMSPDDHVKNTLDAVRQWREQHKG
jgi:peroxiredoxin